MKKHLPYVLIAAAALALDQISKYLIEAFIPLGGTIPIIDGFFDLTYVRNTGAAWSLFAGSGMTFFYVITAVALAALVLFYRHTSPRDVLTRCGLALMISGALGNLIDRICFQYVRDFLHFNFFGYDFPVFNIADICVVWGILLGAVYYLFLYEKYDAPKKEGESHGADPRRS